MAKNPWEQLENLTCHSAQITWGSCRGGSLSQGAERVLAACWGGSWLLEPSPMVEPGLEACVNLRDWVV